MNAETARYLTEKSQRGEKFVSVQRIFYSIERAAMSGRNFILLTEKEIPASETLNAIKSMGYTVHEQVYTPDETYLKIEW